MPWGSPGLRCDWPQRGLLPTTQPAPVKLHDRANLTCIAGMASLGKDTGKRNAANSFGERDGRTVFTPIDRCGRGGHSGVARRAVKLGRYRSELSNRNAGPDTNLPAFCKELL